MKTRILLSLLALLSLAAPMSAAVVLDPALATGSGAIDPVGSRTVDVQATGTGNLSIAGLLSHDDFEGALQNLGTGFTGGATNIVQFTNNDLPDFQFVLGGAYSAASGASIGNGQRATSATTGYLLAANAGGTQTITLTINLGSYDALADTFTTGSLVVDAIGFTLADIRTGQTATASFYNASNALLSTQVISGPASDFVDNDGFTGSWDGYFGYGGDGTFAGGVASVVLQLDYTAFATTAKGLDDLAFTSVIPVPEPSSFLLLAAATSLMLAGRRGLRARR